MSNEELGNMGFCRLCARRAPPFLPRSTAPTLLSQSLTQTNNEPSLPKS